MPPRRTRRQASSAANPRVAVGYLRVSTDDQKLGPEAQQFAIEEWAAREGVAIASWHADRGVSGGAPLERRTALLEALESLRERKAGVLVVARRDRLARDVMIAAMVERLVEREGARIASADGTGNAEGPEGMLIRGIMDLFAQYERAVIRGRIKVALHVKQRRGERVGQIPYGWCVGEDGKMLVKDPEEQRIIEEIAKWHLAGQSIREIAARLNQDGERARGRRWHPTSVARILRKTEEIRSPSDDSSGT